MAQNLSPSHWLPNFQLVAASGTCTKQSIAIPLESLPGLSDSEANASTGDIRKVLRAIMAAAYAAWLAEDAADRPSMMTLSRSTSVDDSRGTTVRNYVSTFRVETTGEEVVAEPQAEE